ncbi:MAG: hypothetical protein ACJAZO_002511 [Myxococcota bacterium]|jgi:hypothetical protein
MNMLVVVSAWLLCSAAAILVGRSPAPSNQHHTSTILFVGLCLCLHVALGTYPPVPSVENPQLFVAVIVGYGLVGAGVAYAVFRASIVLGTRLKPAQ